MQNRSLELGIAASLVTVALSGVSCGDNERPPLSKFGTVSTGGESGDGGTYHPPKGGRSGRGGGGKSSGSGESGDSASGRGDDGGAGNDAGSDGVGQGGAGGKGGKGGVGGAGNLGARGGGGNETAEGGALLTGPDLDCPKVSPGSAGTPPLCDPNAQWGDGMLVLENPSGGDVLLSITPDELSVAWRMEDALSPTLWVADRTNHDEEFGTPRAIDDPMTVGATQITLSPSRLRLVAAISGELVEFVRTTTADDFTFAGRGYYAAIDADAAAQAMFLADPVLSLDESTFYYTLDRALGYMQDGPTLYVAKRTGGGDFPVGEPVDECELDRVSTGARRPTGISADGRTLFFYDEARSKMRAAWRTTPEQPFDTFVDLPLDSAVQPNAACDRLYYSAPTDMGLAVLASDEE